MIGKTFWFNEDDEFYNAYRWCCEQMGPSYAWNEDEHKSITPKTPNWEIKNFSLKGGGIMIWEEQYIALAILKFSESNQ